MRLEGRTAVVTGGASGIGAATVRRFVDEGAEVCIADIAIDAAEALADGLDDAVWAISATFARRPRSTQSPRPWPNAGTTSTSS